MLILGNIALAIAALFFIFTCHLIYFRTVPGGDAGVGYAWSVVICVGVFSLSLLAASAIIGWQGGFGWVGISAGERTVLVLLGLLLIMVGNGFFMMAGYPGDIHPMVRPLIRLIPAVLPLLLLVGAGVLLNFDHAVLPKLAYKIPIYGGLALSALGFVFILVGRVKNAANIIKSEGAFRDKIHQDHLNHIDTTDVMKDMVFLLVLTDANQDEDVREKALAKIKSRPDWQQELIRRLQNDWAPEAFTFLASNEVDDKNLFPEAVRQGVMIQAKLIRESIRRCRGSYDLYPGSFSWEVGRVLRTVDKFQGMGVEYRPAVQEMRNALEEPSGFEKPKLPVIGVLDKWLKQH